MPPLDPTPTPTPLSDMGHFNPAVDATSSSAPVSTHNPSNVEITVGHGRTSAIGQRIPIDLSWGLVNGLMAAIDAQPNEEDAWLGLGTWKGDHRSEKDFDTAMGAGFDADYHDDAGEHAVPPETVVAALKRAMEAVPPPGNVFYRTPRGFRVLVAFQEPTRDRASLQAFKAAFATNLDAWIAGHGLTSTADGKRKRNGFAVDRSTLDLARMFYRPQATVGGVRRDERTSLLRSAPYAPTAPADTQPVDSTQAMKADRHGVRGSDGAVRAFNDTHPGDWPKSGGTCPACGHDQCFGVLADDQTRWVCFSASHEADSNGCGIPGKGSTACFHGDALDLAAHAAGVSREELLEREGLLPADGDDADSSGRRSVARKIVDLVAAAEIELWHTPDNVPYADVRRGQGRETLRVGSTAFDHFVKNLYFGKFESAPPAQAMTDAIGTLEAMAIYGRPEHVVFVRVAATEDRVFIDLGNKEGEVVEVRAGSWGVILDPPVRFRRTSRTRALPTPKGGQPIESLRPFLRPSSEEDFYLCVVWLIAALSGRAPFVIMIVQGEQGSGKSTRTRVVVSLIDPSQAALRSPPRDERDAAIAASNRYVLACDNLSSTKEWLADELCRIATGGGLSTRKLYEDDEEMVFEIARPVVLNGIPDLATRPDLADRAIVARLKQIEETERKTEKAFWDSFEAWRPWLLGSLLDTLAKALAVLPTVVVERLPRMADFARLGVAVERVLAWPEGSFLAAYQANRTSSFESQLSADPVVAEVLSLLGEVPAWEGTSTALYAELCGRASESASRSQGWPRSPRGLHDHLQRLAPALRSAGVDVSFERTGKRRVVRIERSGGSPPGGASLPLPGVQ